MNRFQAAMCTRLTWQVMSVLSIVCLWNSRPFAYNLLKIHEITNECAEPKIMYVYRSTFVWDLTTTCTLERNTQRPAQNRTEHKPQHPDTEHKFSASKRTQCQREEEEEGVVAAAVEAVAGRARRTSRATRSEASRTRWRRFRLAT